MAQPRPEVAVASVCLIAVLYNYEQWRDRETERPREAWRMVEASRVPCEIHTVEDTAREKERDAERATMRRREEERDAFVASE